MSDFLSDKKTFHQSLLDTNFLHELDLVKSKEILVKITVLNFKEEPIESIEGMIQSGSINIDGTSALRRSCALSVIAQELNIKDTNWKFKNKFKLEIGIINTINTALYPEIIWFSQGIFVITAFNITNNTNSYNVSISGKDKMCLLNGNIGGNLVASIDFGVEEIVDNNGLIHYRSIPIKEIIRESLHTYANELYHNIIINDLDEAAVELLEYRGDIPLYLLRDINTAEFVNFTLHGETKCYVNEIPITLEQIQNYDTRLPEISDIADQIRFDGSNRIYTVAKIENGETVGYRSTDLTYAGDLISNTNETLTSIYDKIVAMLGNYEYFYDINGKFVFQRKPNYTSTSWNNIVKTEAEEDGEKYVANAAYTSAITYNFTNNELISSISNSPNLSNLKNDYIIWGQKETVSGAIIPIHLRCAIDVKPDTYVSITVTQEEVNKFKELHPDVIGMKPQESKVYDSDSYDWRELIYQMAQDYYHYNQFDNFLIKVAEANPELFPIGITGYEQYYSDFEGYWRELYNPQAEGVYNIYDNTGTNIEIEPNQLFYINGRYKKVTNSKNKEKLYTIILVNGKYEIHPLLEAIEIDYLNSFPKDENGEYIYNGVSSSFYVNGKYGEKVPITYSKRLRIDKKEMYIKENEEYKTLLESSKAKEYDWYEFLDDNILYQVTDTPRADKTDNTAATIPNLTDDMRLLSLYYVNGKYLPALYQTPLDIEGKPLGIGTRNSISIEYYYKTYDYILPVEETDDERLKHKYWNKDLLDEPSNLNFWFDFIDESSELGDYGVSVIGDRTKVINDSNITSIYFREVPNLIFTTYEDYRDKGIRDKTGYIPVFITNNLENLFKISSQGKSAQDSLDELLYNHTYCNESITLTTIPIYYLQPNTRIFVQDEKSQIEGEYIINKISLQLNTNGTMTISATRAPTKIY